jgi:hypothetical protein
LIRAWVRAPGSAPRARASGTINGVGRLKLIPIPPEVKTRRDVIAWMKAYFPRRFAEVMGGDLHLLAEDDPVHALFEKHFNEPR